ncbi:hypothetical protein KFE25_008001 [Diacronema lutheri]|uniref:Uncharacterized protein n=1 Tax=Diacronema lutheri TaxID=2081491 RepID=A0A8J5XQN4_DIALT|nr:hypothetical protein KFE25_008001 [Diacronema lutheri]
MQVFRVEPNVKEFVRHVLGRVHEEKPQFEVVRKLPGGGELRRYAPHVVAQTVWKPRAGAEPFTDTREPFFALANYIGVFGEAHNTKPNDGEPEKVPMTAAVTMGRAPEKIAMTAPVQTGEATAAGEGARFMRFMLPSTYTLATAPRPTNPAVQLVEVPAKLIVAVSFSGRLTARSVDVRGARLVQAIAADGVLTPVSGDARPWYAAGFNPPWTLPPLRTNEVYVEVLDAGAPIGHSGVSAAQLQTAAAVQSKAAASSTLEMVAAGLLVGATVAGASVWWTGARPRVP